MITLNRSKRNPNNLNSFFDEWLEDAMNAKRWGELHYHDDQREFPSRGFSFNWKENLGPPMKRCHPHLHPTRYQSWDDEVRLFIQTKGPLPMESFCGFRGSGLIQLSTINAAVLQGRSLLSAQSTEAELDAVSLAPNFDLLMSCREAEQGLTNVGWMGHRTTWSSTSLTQSNHQDMEQVQ